MITIPGKRILTTEIVGALNLLEWEYTILEDRVWVRVQGMPAVRLHHDFVEHEDGTVTVSPSIAIRWDYGEPADRARLESSGIRMYWHGFLEHGIFREVG